jgi:hypothetical protein
VTEPPATEPPVTEPPVTEPPVTESETASVPDADQPASAEIVVFAIIGVVAVLCVTVALTVPHVRNKKI